LKYYLKKFIKENYKNKTDGYLFILWAVFKNLGKDRKLHDSIKRELQNIDLETFDFLRKKEKALRILQKLEISSRVGKKKLEYSTIKSIQIKNFKGFGSLNDRDNGVYIELDEKKNIFFGPNGAGKTSFCEAFEYYLTGDIKEAKRRGIKVKDYISREGKNGQISIKFVNPELNNVKISDDDKQFFQKCFIEKNRIQEFALFGSKDTGVKDKDVIATLLGLNDLDNFISSFAKSTSFDFYKNNIEKQIELLNAENKSNKEMKTAYESDIENIYKRISNYFGKNDEINLERIEEKISEYSSKVDSINKEIERLSNVNLPKIDRTKIKNDVLILKRKLEKYNILQYNLVEQIINLNLDDFYNSLLKLKEISNDRCPACDTDLRNVKVNPYEKASSEIKKLEGLKKEKESFNKFEEEISEYWYNWSVELIKTYQECLKRFDELNFEQLNHAVDELRNVLEENKNVKGKVKLVFQFMEYLDGNTEIIFEFYKRYIGIKRKIQSYEGKIIELKNSVNEIKSHLEELQKAKTQIETIKSGLKEINNRLNSYNENLDLLKRKKQAEDNYNKFVKDVSNSYNIFYKDLINFRNKIEQEQIENIDHAVLSYYQAINRSDDPSEFVTEIKFILKDGNYRINFRTADSSLERDVHACLSEGHLRALGLSIMLAVAEKNNVPFLIFDDVVNAIDSEHRANIIEMIFNNKFLKKTQMIITTHDRLFWERFCNTYQRVSAKQRNGRFEISHILSYKNKGTIIKQHNISFEDKIIKALENYDIRQALVYCRIWFETLATEYCTDNNKQITGVFSKRTPSNLLKPTLESIYDVLEKEFPDEYFIQVIKKDLINWRGQNQEHHAFDETNYNFVHSKTSDEVSAIFEAVRDFADFINTDEQLKHIEESIKNYEQIHNNETNKLMNQSFVQNAPKAEVLKAVNLKEESERKLNYYKERKDKITEKIRN